MEKEIKFIYSVWETIFCLSFIALGWATFIVVMIISFEKGFQSKDWIGASLAFMIYISIDLIFILGVLKYTLIKIKFDKRGITIKKPFKQKRHIPWTFVESISEGLVPSYLYGPTKGYTIKANLDNSVKEIYVIKSKKVTVFLDEIMSINKNT